MVGDAVQAAVVLRWARRDEAYAVGLLALDGLSDAPSSEVSSDDVYSDPREFGGQLLAGAASVLVAEESGRGLLGGMRVVSREFIRASHVAEMALLVAPWARGAGVGVSLLDHAVDELRVQGRYAKLLMRVAADDQRLMGVLRRSVHRWELERRERAALWRDGQLIDMHLHALILNRNGTNTEGSA